MDLFLAIDTGIIALLLPLLTTLHLTPILLPLLLLLLHTRYCYYYLLFLLLLPLQGKIYRIGGFDPRVGITSIHLITHCDNAKYKGDDDMDATTTTTTTIGSIHNLLNVRYLYIHTYIHAYIHTYIHN